MKTLSNYITEKILINKDSKFTNSYIDELIEDFVSITELGNNRKYIDIFKQWLSDNKISEVYCIIDNEYKNYYDKAVTKHISVKYSDIIKDTFNNSKSHKFNMLFNTYGAQMYELNYPEFDSPLLMVRIYDPEIFYITFLEGDGKI